MKGAKQLKPTGSIKWNTNKIKIKPLFWKKKKPKKLKKPLINERKNSNAKM